MEILIPLMVGWLVSVSLYLILRRNAFSLFIGLVLLSHAVNLLILSSGALERAGVPISAEGSALGRLSDPLPQALILTAIVIGLGVQAYVLVLIYRLIQSDETYDIDQVRLTEPACPAGEEDDEP